MRNVILYQLKINVLDLNDSIYQLYATSFICIISGKKAMGSMSQHIFLISYGQSEHKSLIASEYFCESQFFSKLETVYTVRNSEI